MTTEIEETWPATEKCAALHAVLALLLAPLRTWSEKVSKSSLAILLENINVNTSHVYGKARAFGGTWTTDSETKLRGYNWITADISNIYRTHCYVMRVNNQSLVAHTEEQLLYNTCHGYRKPTMPHL